MLFAHCLAFEALLGCFYVEKKSAASAKCFLVHSLCLSFQSCFPTRCGGETHTLTKTGGFPVQKLESAFGASNVSCPLIAHASSSSHGPSWRQLPSSPFPVFETGRLKLMAYLVLRAVAWDTGFICVLSYHKKMQLLHH